MAALWNLSVALATLAAAWSMRSDPVVVFAAGYLCALHAERLWDVIRSSRVRPN